MASVNKVLLVGNVGKDPDIRSTQSGTKIANLSIATSESWKDKATGERKENTQWHKVTVFNDALVNVVERFVKKGSKLYLEGQLETRKWTDDSGKDNYITEVILRPYRGELVLLDGKRDEQDTQESANAYRQAKMSPQAPNLGADLDDTIPF